MSVEQDDPPGSRPLAVPVPGIPYTSQSEQRRGAASERRDVSNLYRPCRSNTAFGYEGATRLTSAMLRLTPPRTRFLVSRFRHGEDQVTALRLNAVRSCSAPGLTSRGMPRSVGGLARGEMASHVIDGQSATYESVPTSVSLPATRS
jgi:hypothetical protein